MNRSDEVEVEVGEKKTTEKIGREVTCGPVQKGAPTEEGNTRGTEKWLHSKLWGYRNKKDGLFDSV